MSLSDLHLKGAAPWLIIASGALASFNQLHIIPQGRYSDLLVWAMTVLTLVSATFFPAIVPTPAEAGARIAAKLASKAPPAAGFMKPGAMVLLLVGSLLSLVLYSASGCGPAGKAMAGNLEACAVGQVPSLVAGLLGEVEAAMVNGGVQWNSEVSKLEALGLSNGVNLAICAISAAMNSMRASAARLNASIDTKAIALGESYLKAHGVK